MDLRLLKPLTQGQVAPVKELLSGIHRTALCFFTEGRGEGQTETWIYHQAGEVLGVFSSIAYAEYIVCYAVFPDVLLSPEVFGDLDALLLRVMDKKGHRSLFYNVRGDNALLVAHLWARGFRSDTVGYEMCCTRMLDGLDNREGLTLCGYAQEHFDDYVSVLDGAFNPLMARTGGQADAFLRSRESLRKKLAERGTKGDFLALWKGHRLIGVVYVTEDVIEVLAVAPPFQNQGYGGILIRQAVRRLLQDHGYPAAYLFVVSANQAAKRMYLRQGFRVTGYFCENTYVGITC